MRQQVVNYFKSLQDTICTGLEQADGKATFAEDTWAREEGGGGRTRVIQDGNVLEKGGVNFSEVFGAAPAFLTKEAEHKHAKSFVATGVSIVLHPKNPKVPIIHMNVRYLELLGEDENHPITYWFGGGIDLTPIYVDKEEAVFFHRALKNACDAFHINLYPEFKKWADDYFFIKHRNETRGIGGVFFDHLNTPSMKKRNIDSSANQLFDFVQAIGNTFLPTYTHIIKKNKRLPYTPQEKQWQLLRRGRYAEFNLVYDRGTKFGLETNGRTESILMSLPPQANWAYNFAPAVHSAEEQTTALLKKGIHWV
jgi:coproporphyrinogen III oxidase